MEANPLQPKATVLMTAYGHQPFLEKALASAVRQDYPNLEILFIDDGTKPSLEKRVSAFNDSRIRYHYMEHKGSPYGMIKGMHAATGKYVAILDSDDVLIGRSIANRVEALEKSNAGLCFGDNTLINEHGDVYGIIRNRNCKTADDIMTGYFARPIASMKHSSVMFRRDAAINAGNYDASFSICYDINLIIKVAKESGFVQIHDLVVNYRTHGSNMTKGLIHRLKIIEQINSIIDQNIEGNIARIGFKTANTMFNLAKAAYLIFTSNRNPKILELLRHPDTHNDA
jgi:glycosyltransferase involved in cell wall biosynthesis